MLGPILKQEGKTSLKYEYFDDSTRLVSQNINKPFAFVCKISPLKISTCSSKNQP